MGRDMYMHPAPWEKERHRRLKVRQEQEEKRELEAKKQQESGQEATTHDKRKAFDTEQDLEWEEQKGLGILDMGRGEGAWPYYLRLLFITAYRYVSSLSDDDLPCEKARVLRVILWICPSHRDKVENPFEKSCNNPRHETTFLNLELRDLHLRAMSESGGLEWKCSDKIIHHLYNEYAVINGEARMYLDAAGLDPIAELAIGQYHDLPPSVVRRAAAMFIKLMPFVPQTVEDLAGTPYDASDEVSLDNCGVVKLVRELIPLFVRAAEFGDCIAYQAVY